jgi:prepilin peptidase CpaA
MSVDYSLCLRAVLLTPGLAYLCVSDIRRRTLPNAWTLGGLAVALAMAAGLGGLPGFLDSLAAAGCGVLFLILPFLLRAAGAGDVKMLAACAAFVGMRQVPFFLLAVSFAGLAVAIVMVLMRQVSAARLKHAFRTLFDWRYDRKAGAAAIPKRDDERARVPFGVAIAIGTWATLIQEAIA